MHTPGGFNRWGKLRASYRTKPDIKWSFFFNLADKIIQDFFRIMKYLHVEPHFLKGITHIHDPKRWVNITMIAKIDKKDSIATLMCDPIGIKTDIAEGNEFGIKHNVIPLTNNLRLLFYPIYSIN